MQKVIQFKKKTEFFFRGLFPLVKNQHFSAQNDDNFALIPLFRQYKSPLIKDNSSILKIKASLLVD